MTKLYSYYLACCAISGSAQTKKKRIHPGRSFPSSQLGLCTVSYLTKIVAGRNELVGLKQCHGYSGSRRSTVKYVAQFIHYNSKLLAPDFYFADVVYGPLVHSNIQS